jgi:uncharacterized protein YbjT (DUF2867 family)
MSCEHDQAADAAKSDYAKWVAAVLCEKFKYSVETPTASGRTWINTGPEAVDVTKLAEMLATEADWRVRLWREPPADLRPGLSADH